MSDRQRANQGQQPDPTEVPTHHENPARRRADGLVLVNTGDGKGKSTAAFGIVVRAVARDWRVAVVQFIKSGKWRVGEEAVCRDRLGVDWWAIGEGFSWDSEDLDEDQAVAVAAWEHARALIAAGEHTLIVLDEITYPINWGWIDGGDVAGAISGRPPKVNVVCTGRDAPEALVEIADTVTEMRKVKHAYDTGVLAKKGIDY
jgi:cob(I)alamin adenosyltransferase